MFLDLAFIRWALMLVGLIDLYKEFPVNAMQ